MSVERLNMEALDRAYALEQQRTLDLAAMKAAVLYAEECCTEKHDRRLQRIIEVLSDRLTTHWGHNANRS